jgi:hypothetical protein
VTRQASLERTVTVFANLDLALADATIGLYDAKYHYLVWRPVTAIQLGNTIGNPGIVGDPSWNPLAVTAADPSYPAPTRPSARRPPFLLPSMVTSCS